MFTYVQSRFDLDDQVNYLKSNLMVTFNYSEENTRLLKEHGRKMADINRRGTNSEYWDEMYLHGGHRYQHPIKKIGIFQKLKKIIHL